MDAIDTLTLEHDGFTVHIAVTRDEDASPFDADCYTPADIAAWRRDEWIFVTYTYTATRHGVELGRTSIGGSHWDFPGTESSIGAWIAENYYHPDLLAEAAEEARATLAQLCNA